jgi:hypothetical protein
MDARAVAAAADLGVNTLNVWVARGMVPGMSIGTRGLRRDFSLETATAVIIMAELTRFGLSALSASSIAGTAMRGSAKWILTTKLPTPSEKTTNLLIAHVDSDSEVAEKLNELRAIAEAKGKLIFIGPEPPPPYTPSVFVIINLETLTEKMRAAHDEWQRRHDETSGED